MQKEPEKQVVKPVIAQTEKITPKDSETQTLSQAQELDEKAKGDVEAMEMDPSFITSLSYGMTSAGGCGLGIDRLTMLMGNMGTIKQAIAFPATKTQAKIDLTIGEKDRVKKDIEEIVKEVLDIIQIKEELSLLKNYLRKKAKAINNEDIEALKRLYTQIPVVQHQDLTDWREKGMIYIINFTKNDVEKYKKPVLSGLQGKIKTIKRFLIVFNYF